MAWTTTKVAQYNAGNQNIQQWKLVAESATLELSTGLGVIDCAVLSPADVSTANVYYGVNVTSAAVASNGMLAVTGATSGDVFYVAVYGH